MRWRRQTSYHGSREYASGTPVGNLSIGLGLLLKLIQRRRKVVHARAPSREPIVTLKMRDPTGFTLLGLPGFDGQMTRRTASEDWSQLDQWADEGGAVVPPPPPHAAP